jgi:signal transduction histidine kinase
LAAERRDVAIALALTNGALTILLATAGWFLVARMMRPVRILSQHLGVVRETLAVPIPDDVVAETRGEFGRLFRGYNALVRSMKEREDLGKRLAEEKRLGSLGRLASVVAHEINNPLGGLFNAVSTLKMHGHLQNVRISSLGLLERGLIGIRDVVRTTLTIYRTDAAPRDLAPADINDLSLLVGPEARRKSVAIVIRNALTETIPIPSTPIRQALLNLILNAVAASPAGSDVIVSAGLVSARLEIVVTDSGPGLPSIAAAVLTGRSSAPPPLDGGGLGLWTISRLVGELRGEIDLARSSSGGTVVKLTVPISSLELSNVA